MRNLWTYISIGIGAFVVGGLVVTFVIRQDIFVSSVPSAIPPVQQSLNQSGNPLLTAPIAQLDMWYPGYCGADIYVETEPNPTRVTSCVNTIIERVELSTGIKLTREDVLDPRVKARWQARSN